MDIFSLVGKISVDYADAITSIDKVSKAGKGASDSLNDVDDSSKQASKSVNDAGESAQNANGGFSTWKATLADLAANAITSVIQKCTELAEKVVDLTKSAVSNFADYEQLVGGVETLYKDSSDQLIQYAETAYKTAGLSANEYMETATSFAAAMIQGLGGNTSKAVRLTDVAITDMADNANKMGSDISSIQNAYQGFAKQNYTMLDNLKLGYGGTQEEMVRLINDSGILKTKIENLDNISFSQIVIAIHAIQDQMGITGTTAAEAASTISGNWASVQALFQNILTKVGAELAPTVMAFLTQLSEWMQSIDWDAFASMLGDAFSSILSWIQQINFREFFQKGIEGVVSLAEKLGSFIETVGNVLSNLQNLKQIFITLAPVIAGVVAAFTAFKGIMAIQGIIHTVTSAISGLGGIIGALTSPIGIAVVAIGGLVAAGVALYQHWDEIKAWASEKWNNIKQTISDAVETVKTNVSTAWDNIKQKTSDIWETVKSKVTTAWDTMKSKVSTAANTVKSKVSTAWDTIKSKTSTAWDTVKSKTSTAWDTVKQKVGDVMGTLQKDISDGMNSSDSVVGKVLNSIGNVFTTTFSSVKTFVSDKVEWLKKIFDFNWELPKLKLPHFKVEGKFSLNPPSIPKFSIDWYKKAMDDGMIMNQPTIFGFNQKSNQFMAGGESGSETIVGTENLMGMIKTAVAAENEALVDRFETLISMLADYFPTIVEGMKRSIVLDSGTLVGELAPAMDAELGYLIAKKGR